MGLQVLFKHLLCRLDGSMTFMAGPFHLIQCIGAREHGLLLQYFLRDAPLAPHVQSKSPTCPCQRVEESITIGKRDLG